MIVICITALQLLLSFIFVESCRFPIAPFPPQTYGKVPEAKTLLGGGLIAKQLWTVTKYGLCWVMCKTQTINFPYYSVFFYYECIFFLLHKWFWNQWCRSSIHFNGNGNEVESSMWSDSCSWKGWRVFPLKEDYPMRSIITTIRFSGQVLVITSLIYVDIYILCNYNTDSHRVSPKAFP